MTDLTPVLQAVTGLAVALITAFVVPFIKSKITDERQREAIAAWVKIAVSAAEQLFNGAGQGQEKKDFVVDFLERKGFKVDIDSLNLMIENAVLELNREFLGLAGKIAVDESE